MLRRLSYLALLSLGITLSSANLIPRASSGLYPDGAQGIRLVKQGVGEGEETPRLATLRLGAGERLSVSFDLLSAEPRELYYRISPRDSRGQASELQAFEAFTAFAEQDINDMRQASVSGLPYVHYSFELAERELGFKTSGYYLVEVLQRGDEGKALLSIPLYVYEGSVGGSLSLKRSLPGRYADKEQLLELQLDLPRELSPRRTSELWVRVMQNESEDFPSAVLHQPSQQRPERWSYQGQRAAKFWAGNEYRYIEHLSLQPQGYGIVSVGTSPEGWATMQLAEDRDARGVAYQTRQDRQGRQILRSDFCRDVAHEGEYHIAEFRLRSPRLEGYDVVLEGQAFDYTPRLGRTLAYDDREGLYRLAYPLKNGYQEYRYALIPQQSEGQATNPAAEPLDGSHYQTKNSYQALVYYRPEGARHDRLLTILYYYP